MSAAPVPRRYWIGVISKAHAQLGIGGGFTQLNHGKRASLARMRAGDWFVIYSPRTSLDSKIPYQCFTGIGRVRTGEIYQVDMGNNFTPYRLDIDFLPCQEAPIAPLIAGLSFIADKQHWGYTFRTGHLEVSESDFKAIATAMGVTLEAPQ